MFSLIYRREYTYTYIYIYVVYTCMYACIYFIYFDIFEGIIGKIRYKMCTFLHIYAYMGLMTPAHVYMSKITPLNTIYLT